jgi:DNA-binding NtrC family response regulator
MADGSKATVLVVDDEALVRMDLVDMLTTAGYLTREACCAAEAIELLDHDPDIRVVFTDIQMPGSMDGLALSHHIRKQRPEAIIIISSGNRSPAQSDMPSDADFIAKPFGILELDKILNRISVRLSS